MLGPSTRALRKAMVAMQFLKVRSAFCFLWVGILQSLIAAPLATAQLTVDYSLDSSGFFNRTPAARRALEAAVSDLDAALNQNLAAITQNDQSVSRTIGIGTFSIFDIRSKVRNPTTNSNQLVSAVSGPSDLRIFVGARNLPGSQLGFAGPSGIDFRGSFAFDFGGLINVGPASLDVAATVESIYTRGEGPVVGTATGTISGSGSVFPVQFEFGLLSARIAFDSDVNRYHFDHTTTPASDKFDFYSVALHELLHCVGMGASDEWDSNTNGSTWRGSEVIRLRGNGRSLIASDDSHLVTGQGILSPKITDGAMQESALVPMTKRGVRIRLTELDLALLRDIGFANAVVPPRDALLGDFDSDGAVDLDDLDEYNGNLDQVAVGPRSILDLNGNGSVDEGEFEVLYTAHVETSNGVVGTVAGDINLDGRVDVVLDAFPLVWNLGNSLVSSWSQGDFNADGVVDVVNDAFLLIGNLGANNE